MVYLVCRYAGLYFVMGVDRTDNELLVLEVIHKFGMHILIWTSSVNSRFSCGA